MIYQEYAWIFENMKNADISIQNVVARQD